jgi:transposase-like protein
MGSWARRRCTRGYRFPVEVIAHCVWLYYRFPLSFREIEEMMMHRGVILTHETVRAGVRRSGKPTPTGYVAAGVAQATNGIWTRCS